MFWISSSPIEIEKQMISPRLRALSFVGSISVVSVSIACIEFFISEIEGMIFSAVLTVRTPYRLKNHSKEGRMWEIYKLVFVATEHEASVHNAAIYNTLNLKPALHKIVFA